ncbi:MAG TPA: hypothetical protein VEZ90_06740, partial [Blastocatellia bacterium]|nr:hypothetical protein [Blastocatellia bacterium]
MVAPTAQLGFAEQVYLEAGKALVAGKRAGTVVQELAMMGIPHPVAQDIVAKAGQAKRAAFRKAG